MTSTQLATLAEPTTTALVPASTSTVLTLAGPWSTMATDNPFGATPEPDVVFAEPKSGNGSASGATTAGWLLALSPLLQVALALGAGLAAASTAPALVIPALGAGLALGVLLTLALVIADRRALRSRGVLTPPSVLWWLLGPLVYLIVRTLRVGREAKHGGLPPLLYVLATVLALGAVAFVGMSAQSGSGPLAPVGLRVAEQVAALSIQQDLSLSGEAWTVDCADGLSSLAAGAELACVATGADDIPLPVSGTVDATAGALTYSLDSGS